MYVTCENCKQVLPHYEWICTNCGKEWFIDFSKCRHDDLNSLQIYVGESCIPNHFISEIWCKNCHAEIPTHCFAQLGLDDIATFTRPDGSKLEVCIVR